MKKLLVTVLVTIAACAGAAAAEQAKGLNVIVTTADRQAQMMAMVLSFQAIKAHGGLVNLTFCGAAGDLALKTTETETFPPLNKSPSMLLKALLDLGATVQVCPLYLPSVNRTPDDLLSGIHVAKPPEMAGRLLDRDFQNLTF